MELKEKQELGLSYFEKGFNCAQSSFIPFAKELDIDTKSALRVTGAMGGGIQCGNNMCGAVLGIVSAIGSKYGQTEDFDAQTKQHCTKVTKEFLQAFRAKYGYVNCEDLLGYNINNVSTEGKTEEELKEALKERRAKCCCFVKDAIAIGDEFLK